MSFLKSSFPDIAYKKPYKTYSFDSRKNLLAFILICISHNNVDGW